MTFVINSFKIFLLRLVSPLLLNSEALPITAVILCRN